MLIPDSPLTMPAAWYGRAQTERSDWIYELNASEVRELEQTLAHAKRCGKPLAEITATEFPLPKLAVAIAAWVDELASGRGFLLVRGVPVVGKTVEECELMYWGIGTHMGSAVSQNAHGDVLGHVRDTGDDPADPSVRLYKTRVELGFHTDGADIIGLLCLENGRSGGASRISSSVTVFNEVLRRRPDLVLLLFDSFPFDRNEEQSEGEPPYFPFPLCSFDGEHLRTFYIGWYIRGSQRHPEAPRLTDAQRELIDLIDEIASSPDVVLEMDFQPGDIQLLKNSVILHARTEYKDYPEPERRRHLLRLWLTGHTRLAGGDPLLQGGIPRKTAASEN